MLVLLTGEIGVGKTTVCQETARRYEAAGHSVGGVLAPAQLDAAGVKTGIVLLSLASGERRLQASATADLGGRRVGRYAMDNATLAWGAGVILADLATGRELVIIDEIGPLELWSGGGFAAALPALLARHEGVHAVVVVRSYLLGELERRLASAAPRSLHVTCENRAELPAQIVALLDAERTRN